VVSRDPPGRGQPESVLSAIVPDAIWAGQMREKLMSSHCFDTVDGPGKLPRPACTTRHAPPASRGSGMRRRLVRSLAVAALLCLSSPLDAFSQAATPQPQFSITGFIDTVGTWTQNLSQSDLNFNQNRDDQFYGRNRGRFDIIGQVGEAKGVFGFEIDAYWGQTGFSDPTGIGNGEPCFTTGTANNVTCGAAGQGAESSFDLNTDTQGSLQVKWLYVEFPCPSCPSRSSRGSAPSPSPLQRLTSWPPTPTATSPA